MNVHLAFGEDGLVVDVPDGSTIVRGRALIAADDETELMRNALREPHHGQALNTLLGAGVSVAIVFPDITRPMPNRTVLTPLLDELEHAGVLTQDIELICATGSHRPPTAAEFVELLGQEITERYRVRNHVATDHDHHTQVGTVDGVPILIDRGYVNADVKITTGFVEPHFFAGLSGGPKAVCPGLAALETILEAHHPRRIAAAQATWLVLDGNPVHEFIKTAAALAPPHFSIDVVIDEHRRLVRAFAGIPSEAHAAACTYVRASVIERVAGRFDIVVTTNGGYPLDRNLYQAVKGITAAEKIVNPGGTIVMAAECRDGIPAEGAFGDILRACESPSQLVNPDQPPGLDVWQAQVLGRALGHAHVAFHSTHLTAHEIRAAHLEPTNNISKRVAEALRHHGPKARVCVLPRGPLTVAELTSGPEANEFRLSPQR